MSFEERKYQNDCVDAWYRELNSGLKSLVAVPTGAGKTVILCKTLVKWFETHESSQVLVLSHTQEIVQQDYDSLLEYFPSFGVGIYSAGLKSKEIKKITVASIQSVYRSIDRFKNCDLVIVDEAHTINHKDAGMYRTLFNALDATIGGMTATIFRTGYGYIHEGDSKLFESVAFDLTSLTNFNRLVKDGYLTKLISKGTENELDSSNIKKSAGDYNLKDLAKKHDRKYVTERVVAEIVAQGANYKKWLVFAIDIDHCEHICQELVDHGIDAVFLHSKMSADRTRIIDDFKNGNTRALVSVGMVTTGFDAPNVDLIALLRPTLSPVLHVQMVGRGLRTAPGKDHCLVLDFAGNVERLGPINNPIVKGKQKTDSGAGEGEAPTKKCPQCKTIVPIIKQFCDGIYYVGDELVHCDHEFTFETKLKLQPSAAPVVAKSEEWLDVDEVFYYLHHKVNKPISLKVSYRCGMQVVSEWICLNHSGYAKTKANAWVKKRMPYTVELTTEEVYKHSRHLAVPKQICVKRGKWVSIVNYKF